MMLHIVFFLYILFFVETYNSNMLYSLAHTLLLNVFSALKGTHFYILFVVIVAGVVLFGSP